MIFRRCKPTIERCCRTSHGRPSTVAAAGAVRPGALASLAGYASKPDDPEVTGAAAIESDRIAVPLLLVAGGDDGVWPSSEMARRLIERRRKAGVAARPTSCCISRGAGHLIRLGAGRRR